MSDQWGTAQPPYDSRRQSRGYNHDQQQGPVGGSGQQPEYGQVPQHGEAPQFVVPAANQQPQPQEPQQQLRFGVSAPAQSGGQHQYPYGRSQSQSTLGAPGQFQVQPQFGDPGQGQHQDQGQDQGQGFGPLPQSGYGSDPGYEAGSYGGAYAGTPYAGAAAKKTNGLALAGAILSIIPLLGLIFSLIGLSKAKALGGAGKTAATVGVVLSLVFAGAYGFGIYKLAGSTAADPACISSESAATSMVSKMNADESAVSRAEGSGDSSSMETALNTMISDLRSIKSEVDSDVAKATHANVKAELQVIDTDLGKLTRDLKAVENGDQSAASDLQSVANRLGAEGNAVDRLCGNVTNG